QADLRLAARAAGGGDGLPAHSTRSAWRRAAALTIASAPEVGLAGGGLGVAVWGIAARDTFAPAAGFFRYGVLVALVLGAPARRRRGADRGCDQRRLGRRPPAGGGRAPAHQRDADVCGTPQWDVAPGGRAPFRDGCGGARGRRAVPPRPRADARARSRRE